MAGKKKTAESTPLQRQYSILAQSYAKQTEIIAELEARLDGAYKEQEEMLVELNRNLNMMKYHCEQVRHNTGEVTLEDVCYCANLINRVMKNKFEYKPKSFEE